MNTRRTIVGGLLLAALFLSGCSGLSSEPAVIATLPAPENNPHASLTLTPQATLAPVTGKITGTLSIGTADGASSTANTAATTTSPAGKPNAGAFAAQELVLHIVDPQMQEETVLGNADAQGNFSFENVTIRSDRAYFVSTLYEGREFTSEFVRGDPSAPTVALPITIYGTTDDPAALQLTSLIMQITADANGLFVVQIVRVVNAGDKVFSTTTQPNPGQFASVHMAYPKGATITGFANGDERYVVDEAAQRVIDTQAVFPNTRHLVHFRYQMPYDPAGTVLNLPVDFAVVGDVQLLIAPADLTVSATLGDTLLTVEAPLLMGGTNYLPIKGTVDAKAGSLLRIALKGALPASAAVAQPPVTNNTSAVPATTDALPRELVFGVFFGGGFGFILLGTVMLIRERRRNTSGRGAVIRPAPPAVRPQPTPAPVPPLTTPQADVTPLLAELAQLDDLHAKERISDASYHRRRKALKARIAALMGVEE